ncbi:hypothetical protein ABB30_05420 [Stenotrophomonas ginsengisoli]|uniref:GCVT N-terminal domain-containing protein n=1 Tax=Stenotrophomonas ginsengisoli TaxID=336566 RepID=A0A0R0DJD8_9GAMM|nr:folate-binding protein YgfZ [Stenotrophomonas ginsengisoli]KRG78206.1 hypothetical protein ABB30_05420 [Stenotrophomonas ginsengisoli]
MTDNLPNHFTLPDTGLLRLQGADAETFAQSQFANDVAALAPGQWQWSCWLNAKGRVLDVFALARLAEGDLLLILPDGGAQALGQALQRFVFRRKVRLALDLRPVSGHFGAATGAAGNQLAISDDEVIELDWGSSTLPRTLRIGAGADLAADDPAACRSWQQADLRLGLPRLTAQQRETWTAQQLGLDRLQGYSVRKGCYPGQEIVARTHFLGKAKRATVLLHGVAPDITAGSAVLAGEREIGQLACVAPPYALAVLPLERDEQTLLVAGSAVQAQPLVEGLLR